MAITTRFAPSPTWFVHIWSLRTVLYNYLYAKKIGWNFMLRVEDTDRTRLVDWSIENLLSVLHIFWLDPDEGPNKPGNKWPYYQSERLDIYKKYIEQLLEQDKAYYCFCSSERLDSLRTEQTELWLPTKYDKHCRYLTKQEVKTKIEAGETYTIRLKVPENKDVIFTDTIKWKIIINTKDIDDQVLLKSDAFPTYHFAVVVDDHLMWITDIIRWDEWVPSTPKHILLFEAFGWEIPTFTHLPLLLWMNKKKLSKRTWDVAVEAYLEKWYLVEALLNYIALLGWNPKTTEEFFTMDELIERFDLKQVHKAWAVFDVEKLNFFNSTYLKKAEINYVYEKLMSYLEKFDKSFLEKISIFGENYNKKVVSELKTKIKNFKEFKESSTYFYDDAIVPKKELLLNEKMKIDNLDLVKKALEIAINIISSRNYDFESIDEVKHIFVKKIIEAELKNGQVLWPVRVALSGEEFSSGALELIYILWIEKSRQRLEKVLKNI